MKIAIVGTGNVGCACALAAVTRGSAREMVLVNRTRKTAEAVAADIGYGTSLGPKVVLGGRRPANEKGGHEGAVGFCCLRHLGLEERLDRLRRDGAPVILEADGIL